MLITNSITKPGDKSLIFVTQALNLIEKSSRDQYLLGLLLPGPCSAHWDGRGVGLFMADIMTLISHQCTAGRVSRDHYQASLSLCVLLPPNFTYMVKRNSFQVDDEKEVLHKQLFMNLVYAWNDLSWVFMLFFPLLSEAAKGSLDPQRIWLIVFPWLADFELSRKKRCLQKSRQIYVCRA